MQATSNGSSEIVALGFDAAGAATFNSTVTNKGTIFDFNTAMYTQDSSISSYAANNGLYVNGNSAGYLALRGDGSGKQNITLYGDTSGVDAIYMYTNSALTLRLSGNGDFYTTPRTDGHAVFNENGVDADFRVESDTNTHALFVEGSSSVVNFGRGSSNIESNGGYISAGLAIMSISSAAQTYFVRNTSNTSYSFYVTGAGQIHAVQTSISSLSDERLKENIVDIDTGLAEVMALKPRKFDWKEGEGSNEKNVAGFIAQEVETVLPELIGDFLHDDLDDAKSVKMGDMVPTLVKAIQEQQSLIETLTARIAALEE
jgi:hypothetical protein